MYAQRSQVIISAWDRRVVLSSRSGSVGDALKRANISLSPGDAVVPSADTRIAPGMQVVVRRARPVFVQYDGKVITILTSEDSVAKVLELAAIKPTADDIVVPPPEESVPESGIVRVVHVTYAEVTVDESVAYTTVTQNDPNLEAGLTRVYREGVPGVDEVRYKVRYEDGVEVAREELQRTRVKEPTPRVLLAGTRQEVYRGGQTIRFVRAFEMSATGYCSCPICCGPYSDGYTHIGLPAKKGVIAVDPSVIPLGTRVYVDGYGYAVAADTGSAIKGNKVDLCFDTHQEALAWGVRRVKVYVLGN